MTGYWFAIKSIVIGSEAKTRKILNEITYIRDALKSVHADFNIPPFHLVYFFCTSPSLLCHRL